MNSNTSSDWLLLALIATASLVGVVVFVRRKARRPIQDIQFGCRTEYGPLELRIQAGDSTNGYRIFVEDHRQEHSRVVEEAVHTSLDAAKEQLTVKAAEYLASIKDAAPCNADWRCS